MEKKRRRGFPISFRLVIAGICVLAELALIFAMLYWLKISAATIYSIFQLIGVIFVIYIANQPSNAGYKMAWILFIVTLPLVGCFFYMIRGGSRVIPRVKRRMKALDESSAACLTDDRATARRLKEQYPQAARQSAYLKAKSGYPVYTDTSVEYIQLGENIWQRMLKELEGAKSSIYLEFFILSEGIMWDAIHKILKKKAEQGLDVRIMFDDFGSINRQYRGFLSRMREDGIKVSVFNPIRPSFDMFMNNRNHRKIAVIDGQTAITGSFNIGDEYINEWKRHGHWLDSAVVIKGSAVNSFTTMFLSMWSFINGTDFTPPPLPEPVKAEGYCQPYCDGPFNPENPAEGLYMQILHNAQKYVYITTPYLILDDNMEISLKQAALSGVDVRIITPKVRDKWYVHPVTRSYYTGLLKAGVRIYEYTPGFIHSKVFVSDDEVACVGSVNLDYRSFYFHFECGAWMCGNEAVEQVSEHLSQLFEQSEEITLDTMRKRPLGERIKQSILRLFAPFM